VDEHTSRVAVRQLRNDVAAVVRRAGSGERVIVTVDGRPVAQLGPVEPTGRPSLDDLVAAGLVEPPSSDHRPAADPPLVRFQVDSRPDRLLREVRGR
jgi:prevent-host-death family protein